MKRSIFKTIASLSAAAMMLLAVGCGSSSDSSSAAGTNSTAAAQAARRIVGLIVEPAGHLHDFLRRLLADAVETPRTVGLGPVVHDERDQRDGDARLGGYILDGSFARCHFFRVVLQYDNQKIIIPLQR